MANGVSQDAMQSISYVCGAPVLDPDHPFHSIVETQPTLTCSDHVKPFFTHVLQLVDLASVRCSIVFVLWRMALSMMN